MYDSEKTKSIAKLWRKRYASIFLGTIKGTETLIRNKEIINACDEIERLTGSCKIFEVMVEGLRADLKTKDADLAEARKKPEPMVFTKPYWKWVKSVEPGGKPNAIYDERSYFVKCLFEIDRLTAELAKARKRPKPNAEYAKHFACTKQYLINLTTIITDGPAAFNASEPVMMHLNTLFARLIKDGENIDRLTAENVALKRPLEVANFQVDGMLAIGQALINQSEQITHLQADLKARDVEIARMRAFIQELRPELRPEHRHDHDYFHDDCSLCDMEKREYEQALKETT